MAAILIVEDEFFTRKIAETLIASWGHQTLVAGGVDEALALLRSPARIDALITDLRLKKTIFGGCEVANEAVKLRPRLRVLYTTASEPSDALQAMFVEGAHFLSKPYGPSDLEAAVERLLAGDFTLAAKSADLPDRRDRMRL